MSVEEKGSAEERLERLERLVDGICARLELALPEPHAGSVDGGDRAAGPAPVHARDRAPDRAPDGAPGTRAPDVAAGEVAAPQPAIPAGQFSEMVAAMKRGEGAADVDSPRSREVRGGAGAGAAGTGAGSARTGAAFRSMRWTELNEGFFARAGVLLLFLGLAALFKYSVDQGWIVPWVRLFFGVVLGGGMLGVGFRVERERSRFAALLFGGAVAVLYATGYAAHEVFGLVPFLPAFGFMIAVTGTGLLLALRSGHVELAHLALAGGFATPFAVVSATPSLGALGGYLTLLALAAAVIFRLRAWHSLLVTVLLAGGTALLAASGSAEGVARISLSVAAATLWGTTVVLPILHALRHISRAPSGSPAAPSATAAPRTAAVPAPSPFSVSEATGRDWIHVAIGLTATLGAVRAGTMLWELGDAGSGALAVGLVALLGALVGRKDRSNAVVQAAAVVGALTLMHTAFAVLDRDGAFLSQALLAFAFLVTARRQSLTLLVGVAHLGFALVLTWQLAGIWNTSGFDAGAWARLGTIPLALFASHYLQNRARAAYILAAHFAVMVWLMAEFASLSQGVGMVSVAWGAYGIMLFTVSLVRPIAALRTVALATLVLVALKLIVLDLAAVDMIWRILLFLGFGLLFLGVSYLVKQAPLQEEAERAALEEDPAEVA